MQSIIQYLVFGVISHLVRGKKGRIYFDFLKLARKVTLEFGLGPAKPVLQHNFINPLPIPDIDSNKYNQDNVYKPSFKSAYI